MTLRNATVVGMTTTGAAKYQHLLRRLGVKVGRLPYHMYLLRHLTIGRGQLSNRQNR